MAARQDLIDAAEDLEALGDAARAAEAYGLAGDVEGEARALVGAGDVEKLEEVLERDHARDGGADCAGRSARRFDRLVARGERREALAKARATRRAPEKARSIEARRRSRRARVELRGRALRVALGSDSVVARAERRECAIALASAAVSRRHVAFARDATAAD